MRLTLATLFIFLSCKVLFAQGARPPRALAERDVVSGYIGPQVFFANSGPYYSRAAVVELFEDESRPFGAQLINGAPAEAASEHTDCYSGIGCVRITGTQRYAETIKGWNFPIAANPQPGEYRYIRFAWKKQGGNGIMVQFHDKYTGIWERRYVAGQNTLGYAAISVAAKAPEEWTVVTRDLFADFMQFTITGMALTPMGGSGGLFDHIYLGRTIEDLDKVTQSIRQQSRRQEKLDAARLDRLWDDLASADAAIAQPAISHLVSGHADSLPFIKKRAADLAKHEGDREVLALIAQLDHPRFAKRDEASRKLERLGPTATDSLKTAMAKATSLEVITRIEQLLSKPGLRDAEWSPREWRTLRLLRALEQIESKSAGDLLKELPMEWAPSELKSEWRLANERMEKQR